MSSVCPNNSDPLSINSGMTAFEAARLASIVAGLQCKGMGAIKSIPFKEEVYSAYYGQ